MASITSVEVVNGGITPQATVAALEAAQTSSTHVGTATGDFSFAWNAAILSYRNGQTFIADPLLYAALNACAAAAALITWAD